MLGFHYTELHIRGYKVNRCNQMKCRFEVLLTWVRAVASRATASSGVLAEPLSLASSIELVVVPISKNSP